MSVQFAPYLDGNLIEWVSSSSGEDWRLYGRLVEKRPNDTFDATLSYKTWQRGRSAVRIVWVDEQGHTFPMFMKDMDTLLGAGRIEADGSASWVTGSWVVVKRGANYGISLVNA